MDFNKLSNIELYYSPASLIKVDTIIVQNEESRHILKVMRHTTGDEIFITNGLGSIFKTTIKNIIKDFVEVQILDEFKFENRLKNIYFCIPRLKSADRFEVALEKCTELGVTNFIIFDSKRTIPKGYRTERWQKILTSAMKQSLRSFLPGLSIVDSLNEIKSMKGKKILLSQESDKTFNPSHINQDTDYYFIFGPEGDFTKDEMNLFNREELYNLGNYRLRSETAIIKCASML